VHDEAVVVALGVTLQPVTNDEEYVEQIDDVPVVPEAHDTQ